VLPVYDFIFASHGKLDDRIGISSFLSIRLYYSHTKAREWISRTRDPWILGCRSWWTKSYRFPFTG